MTKVLCCEKDDGFIIEVAGHAGYAEKGKDIVCAGISALCQALYMTVCEYRSEGKFADYACKTSDGYFLIMAKHCSDTNGTQVLKAVFEMFYNGIYEIANRYGRFVNLTWCSEASFGKLTDKDTSEQTVLDFFKKEVE